MMMIWQKIDYFVRIKQREFPEAVVTSCTDYRYEIVKIKIRIGNHAYIIPFSFDDVIEELARRGIN